MHLNLVKKISLPLGILLILMAVMAFTTFFGQRMDSHNIAKVQSETTKHIDAGELRLHFSNLLMAVNDYIITGKKEYYKAYLEQRDSLYRHIHVFSAAKLNIEEHARLETLKTNILLVEVYADSIFNSNIEPSDSRLSRLMEEMDYRYGNQVSTQLTGLYESITNNVRTLTGEMQESDQKEFWYTMVPFLIAFPIAIGVVILTMKKISAPLIKLVHLAERITQRDFSSQLKAETEDEIGVLVKAFNAMAGEIQRRYDELESFAYIVAHDLKNPINAIRGITELTITDPETKLTDEEKNNLNVVIQASDSMTMLINDLLDFARAGKVEISPEPVSLNKILEDVQNDMFFYIGERNAKITVQENLPSIKCDPIRFSQIWKNLLSNALKYNDSAQPRVEITCDSTLPKFIQLNVKDNGIGLEEKDFELIFQPFKRAETEGTYEGTGIGLAIVKRVVDFHGGKVWLSSKVGEGTTFHFTIPKLKEYSV